LWGDRKEWKKVLHKSKKGHMYSSSTYKKTENNTECFAIGGKEQIQI
jgi:hypothetical protein